jgi:hypothetical protein
MGDCLYEKNTPLRVREILAGMAVSVNVPTCTGAYVAMEVVTSIRAGGL